MRLLPHMHATARRWIALSMIVIGIAGVGLSILLYVRTPRQPRVGPTTVAVTTAPSSAKPTPKTVAAYAVPPLDPKYIAIPFISLVNTPIVRLGLLKSGAVATPDNIYDAGWYDASSRPGQAGAMFIYGHVSSWTADGAFYNLKKLHSGNTVTIIRGDNRAYMYRVVSSKIYPYDNVDMNQVLAPINAKVPGLNLMTCTGQVIQGTSEFNERLVVFTELVSS